MSNKRTYGSGGPGLFQKELVPQLPRFGAGAPLSVTQKSPQNRSETRDDRLRSVSLASDAPAKLPQLTKSPPSECVCASPLVSSRNCCFCHMIRRLSPPWGRAAGRDRGGAGRGGTVRARLLCFCVRVRTCCMSYRGVLRKTVGAGFNRIAPKVVLYGRQEVCLNRR